jgi:hypothetical protein
MHIPTPPLTEAFHKVGLFRRVEVVGVMTPKIRRIGHAQCLHWEGGSRVYSLVMIGCQLDLKSLGRLIR